MKEPQSSFDKAAIKYFGFLKDTNRLDDLFAKGIRLSRGGYLLPICELHRDDEALLSKIGMNSERDLKGMQFSRDETVLPAASSWIHRSMDDERALLFQILDRHGYNIGFLELGISTHHINSLVVTSFVVGSSDLLREVLEALLEWAQQILGAQNLLIQVPSDDKGKILLLQEMGSERTVDSHNSFTFCPRANSENSDIILTAGPSISARECSYTLDAVRSGWNHRWNFYLEKFEKTFAEYIGAKHALSTSSCTGALHLVLLALGIGPGDEVIVPDLTWVATANAVLYTGATPVFADVDPTTWVLDPISFEASITSRTKAVLPVHLYGHPAPMDRIVEIARNRGLYVVEDAAPSIGAQYLGRKTGSFGDAAAFSFQGAKLVVTGEGGMIVTSDEQLYMKVYSLWDQGRTAGTFWIQDNGWKYKMSNVQAALGLGQLERVDELIEAKRRIFSWYEEGLRGLPNVSLCYEPQNSRSIYWMSSILLNENARITRDGLREELRKRRVDSRSVFPAISQYPIWPRRSEPKPVAKKVGDQGINLPSGVCLKRDQVQYVCRCIREILKVHG